ncbi:MAG: uracil-DNA glycosylase [Planctomycetota bacterium]
MPDPVQPSLFDAMRAHLELERDMGQDSVPRPKRTRLAPPSPLAPAPTPPATASPSGGETAEAFLKRRAAEIANCTKCTLAEGRTQVVYGVGSPNARLVFIGEGPGRDEDLQGEPFVGRAGQLLTKIIQAMGVKRSDVYIANIVKCRPPENRLPRPNEVRACFPYLEEQFEAIRPKVIVCLGKLAASVLLETDASMGALRGKFYERNGIQVMVTYHPAYLLRKNDPAEKKKVWEDMQKVLEFLAKEN